MGHRPGEISAAAKEWLNQATGPDAEDLSALPIVELRARNRQRYQPAIDFVLAETNVTATWAEVAGVSCLTIEPPNAEPDRIVLYAFGGAFSVGSPEEDIPISARLSVETNAKVIAPAYRLAPENPFPAGLDDITAVAHKILTGSDRVVFAGESAGATLLLSTIHRLRAARVSTPFAAALLSPCADLGFFGDSFETDRDPTLSQQRVLSVPSVYAPNQDLADPDISPIYGAFDADFPPLIVTSGTRDLFLSQSVRLARVMRHAGAEIDLRVWEGMWHVFEGYPTLPEAKASIVDIAEFLNARF